MFRVLSAKVLDIWSSMGAFGALHLCRRFKSLSTDTIKKFCVENRRITDIQSLIGIADDLYTGRDKSLQFKFKSQGLYKENTLSIPHQLRFWFRGHACATWDLVPTVHRYDEADTQGYLESILVKGFIREHTEMDVLKSNVFDVLSKMQHHHYPTRLLDWTGKIAYAAYFACCDSKYRNEDGVIWLLDPFTLNMSSSLTRKLLGIVLSRSFDAKIRSYQAIADDFEELTDYAESIMLSTERPKIFCTIQGVIDFLEKIFSNQHDILARRLRLPIAVDPGKINPRISAQDGKFTISGGKQYVKREDSKCTLFHKPISLVEHVFSDLENYQPLLKCFIIEKGSKLTLLRQLDQILGINESSLMLDIDSCGKVSSALYSFNKNNGVN